MEQPASKKVFSIQIDIFEDGGVNYGTTWHSDKKKFSNPTVRAAIEYMNSILPLIQNKTPGYPEQYNNSKEEDIAPEYVNGYNCGYYGPDEKNCHFSNFATPGSLKIWELGKKAGEIDKQSGKQYKVKIGKK